MGSSPWIWSRRTDLAAFGGSTALALALTAAAPALSEDGALPGWAWFALVLGLDVAHVWTTTFRTYLDRAEVAKRRRLYLLLPAACWLGGVSLHLHSALTFWRVLAYAAVFHFVRQQIGWAAIYRARAGERAPVDRYLDDAVVYAATGWPLLHWHAHLPRAFHWMVDGDFVSLASLGPLVAPAGGLYLALLVAYALRAAQRVRRGRANPGKDVLVATTALSWYVGIVAGGGDFAFTASNVIVHAVPYMVLLWAYARARAEERPGSLIGGIVSLGAGGFLGVALACAFVEELLWERLVWHDRPGWFGGAVRAAPLLSSTARAFVVPLLAVPQAVHYVLDGVLWRRRDTGPAQARALGFVTAPFVDAAPRQ